MPAVSRAQQEAMAIAEHAPQKLDAKNRGLLKMSRSQLHDFAATPRQGLPQHAALPHPHKNLGSFLHPKGAKAPGTALADTVTALRSRGAFSTPRGATGY